MASSCSCYKGNDILCDDTIYIIVTIQGRKEERKKAKNKKTKKQNKTEKNTFNELLVNNSPLFVDKEIGAAYRT